MTLIVLPRRYVAIAVREPRTRVQPKIILPCLLASRNNLPTTTQKIGLNGLEYNIGDSEQYKTACMNNGIRPFSWLAGCKHR